MNNIALWLICKIGYLQFNENRGGEEMITYDRLWETMKKKNISQYHLIHYCNISSSQINRLKKNNYVSTHTIERLCYILQCQVEDIMSVTFDPNYTDTSNRQP